MEQIEIYGEVHDLIAQVIDLSIRFGILTHYTGFHADPIKVDPNKPVEIPEGFALYQDYPSPFNAVTTISYKLPAGKKIFCHRESL